MDDFIGQDSRKQKENINTGELRELNTNSPGQSLQPVWEVLFPVFLWMVVPMSPCSDLLSVSSPTLLKINTELPKEQRLTGAARTEASQRAWSQSH